MSTMSTRRESIRDSGREKAKTKSQRDDHSLAGEQKDIDRKREKPDKQQAKIDMMLSQNPTDESVAHEKEQGRDPTMADLLIAMQSFDQKLGTLASKEYIEESLKKLVTEDFLESKLDVVKEEINKEIKSKIDKIYEKVRLVSSKYEGIEKELESEKNKRSDLELKVRVLTEENDRLKDRTKDLREMIRNRDRQLDQSVHDINDLEQYTRKNSVRIYGLSDVDRRETSESTRAAVINLLKDKLDISVSPTEIDIAHRVGRFSVSANRPIICKFVSREIKSKVIRARKGLKGSSVVIREDLSVKNAKLLEKVSEKDEVKSAWSDDGRIFALLNNGKILQVDLFTNLTKSLLEAKDPRRRESHM